MHRILNVPRSVRKTYLSASYHVYKIGCLLVRGISLPVAQLFVIAIENILRGDVGNLTRPRMGGRVSGRGGLYYVDGTFSFQSSHSTPSLFMFFRLVWRTQER